MRLYTKIFYVLFIFIPQSLLFSQTDESCPNGMISYWKLDEYGPVNYFLDSYAGLTGSTSDSTRPVQDTGIVNQARKFDGKSEITVPENSAFDWETHTSFSIELWIKTNQPGTGNKVFIGKYRGNSKMLWWLGYGGENKIMFSVTDSSGIGAQLTARKIITDSKWHYIVAIRNDNEHVLQIYVDGKSDGIISTFFTGDFKGNGPVYIGYFYDGYHYNGLLDEIALYNRALTQNEISQHYQDGLIGKGYCDTSATDVGNSYSIPGSYTLYQNFPNPFNPTTAIDFNLAAPANVKLNIYNIIGQRVVNLLNTHIEAGYHSVIFDGGDLPSGTYIYRLQANNFIESKKMILLK